MTTTNDRSTATILHLSTLTQYLIPFGNFIFPVIIWSTFRSKSNYIDEQGRQAINFQLSIFLYSIILAVIAVPILIVNVLKGIEFAELYDHRHDLFVENFDVQNIGTIVSVGIVAVIIFIILQVLDFLLVIIAAVKTANGEDYNYPLTINFIGKNHNYESQQLKNEPITHDSLNQNT